MQKISFMAICALLVGGEAIAEKSDRLLPSSSQDGIEISARLDGRAAYVTLKNRTQYVITGFDLYCTAVTKYDLLRQEACRSKRSAEISKNNAQNSSSSNQFSSLLALEPEATKGRVADSDCAYSVPRQGVVKEKITRQLNSGAITEIYAELPSGLSDFSCFVQDLRGREKKWYE